MTVRRLGMGAAALLVGAVVLGYLAYGLRTASYTFACDFFAYAGAADHLLAGQPIYDLSQTKTGECGIYQYPPPFALAALPFALPDPVLGSWAWIAFLVACYWLAIASMPVSLQTRAIVGVVGALSWPFIFGVRIGQVGPILVLLFALGWRWLEQPARVGITTGLGILVKLQPAVIGLWMVAAGRWRAAIVAGVTVVAISAVAFLLGLGDWLGFVTLVRRLSDAATVPANLSVVATLVRFGMPVSLGGPVQLAIIVGLFALVAFAARRLPADVGYLIAVVASQLISPIVWDHYALALLLPVAWLVQRRHWWALLVPGMQAWVLLVAMPTWIYPLSYLAVLAGLVAVGSAQRRASQPSMTPVAA